MIVQTNHLPEIPTHSKILASQVASNKYDGKTTAFLQYGQKSYKFSYHIDWCVFYLLFCAFHAILSLLSPHLHASFPFISSWVQFISNAIKDLFSWWFLKEWSNIIKSGLVGICFRTFELRLTVVSWQKRHIFWGGST